MADGSAPLIAALRFALFALGAIVVPGLGLQRLARVRWDPALVLPLGLAWCALAYALALVCGEPLLFPVLSAAPALALAAPGRNPRAPGPSLRGAVPAIAVIVLLFALTQYPVNRVDQAGAFRLDIGEHVDTALHVGVTFELVAGYPPQVPGLAGVPMSYHVGSHLVRAAAARWAGIHPYDAISRFDITLWAVALVLALRGVAQAIGMGRGVVALAGFLPLLCDLSFVPGLLAGASWWAFKLGGNFVEPLFYANSIVPALVLALGAVLALARAERGEGEGFTVLAALLATATGFFKVFTGAQLLLALGLVWLLGRSRRRLTLVLLPAALALVLLALRSASPAGAAGVSVSFLPFAPLEPALRAFGLAAVHGARYVVYGLAWLLLSLGLRVVGVPAAALALRDERAAPAALAALALCGWPLATFLSITADPDCDESFYFLQASGVLLWLFAAPTFAALLARGARWRRAAAALAAGGLDAAAGGGVRGTQGRAARGAARGRRGARDVGAARRQLSRRRRDHAPAAARPAGAAAGGARRPARRVLELPRVLAPVRRAGHDRAAGPAGALVLPRDRPRRGAGRRAPARCPVRLPHRRAEGRLPDRRRARDRVRARRRAGVPHPRRRHGTRRRRAAALPRAVAGPQRDAASAKR